MTNARATILICSSMLGVCLSLLWFPLALTYGLSTKYIILLGVASSSCKSYTWYCVIGVRATRLRESIISNVQISWRLTSGLLCLWRCHTRKPMSNSTKHVPGIYKVGDVSGGCRRRLLSAPTHKINTKSGQRNSDILKKPDQNTSLTHAKT